MAHFQRQETIDAECPPLTPTGSPTQTEASARGPSTRTSDDIELNPIPASRQGKERPRLALLATKTGHIASLYSKIERYVDDSWTSEGLALAVAALCFVAISIVLKAFDGQPVPNLPEIVSLNAIISVLSTIAKSTLMYAVSAAIGQSKWDLYSRGYRSLRDFETIDEASRGPLGSVRVLLGRNLFTVASLGAVVTVLALAVDPFVQQVIQYSSEPRLVQSQEAWTELATFPSYYSTSDDPTYVGAISGAVWNEASVYDRQAHCPAGNCIWQPFESLGWCLKTNSVADVSGVTVDCSIAFDKADFKQVYEQITTSGTIGKSYRDCKIYLDKNSTTPLSYPIEFTLKGNGNWQAGRPVNPAWKEPFYVTSFPLEIVAPVGSSLDGDYQYMGVSNPILAMGYARFSLVGDPKKDLAPQKIKLEHAEQAVLTLCSKQYNVSVANGLTSTTVLDSHYGKSYPDDKTVLGKGATCWSPGSKRAEVKGSSQSVDGVRYVSDNSTMAFCTTDWGWGSDISARLSSARQVTMTQGDGTSAESSRNINGTANWLPSWSRGKWISSEDVLNEVRSRSLSGVLEPVTASLNSLLGARSSERATGSFVRYETVVQVQWRWMALPYVLVLLGAVFVVAVIHGGHGSPRTWKGSVLAVIYHGLQDGETSSQLSKPSDMGREADETQAKLMMAQNGLRLVQT
ncbi:uncharacterized protein E0L32_004558 [Thyridium curvatum]|uniref:Uncharacterized protein n=1 Tax=Thyridium curvatum TaxID=1093900 RepID=A0A507BEA7_9PEZI|nr:uncharacterized protein E0L32_004558 [Thyridium curvatum]TPX15281.1 hypothetical protein E0L32_004558 [Thyridium curvatum]